MKDFHVVDISKPCDRRAMKPGDVHLQIVKDDNDLPEEAQGHQCTRVVRDPSDNIISISHPDAVEMGSCSVDDLNQTRGEASITLNGLQLIRLRRAFTVILFMTFVAGAVIAHIFWK